MDTTDSVRPDPTEYAPAFAGYISQVPEGDILVILAAQRDDLLGLLGSLRETDGDHRYAPGKWSIKEVVGHVIDAERIFAYRALRFARGDQTPLSGFEQDDLIQGASFGQLQLRDLAAEFEHVRQSSILLFRHLAPEAWQRRGVANDNSASVRALAYVIAGHAIHHTRILRERYLPA